MSHKPSKKEKKPPAPHQIPAAKRSPAVDESELVAAKGTWGKVVWATNEETKSRAREYFSGLGESDRASVLALFQRLAEFGPLCNEQQFKFEKQQRRWRLWAFKDFQLRFLGAFFGKGAFVVAHGFRKKQHKIPPKEFETAARLLDEHEEARERGKK